MSHVNIVVINGYGRSGSSFYELLISKYLERPVLVGELRNIWYRRDQGYLCGCGDRIATCAFWERVFATAAKSHGMTKAEFLNAGLKLSRTVDRFRKFRSISHRPTKNAITYSRILSSLLSSIAIETNCATIVDSSKNPSHSSLVSLARTHESLTTPEFRVINIVLTRNPWDTAASWKKKRRRLEAPDAELYMPQHSVAKSSLLWSISNEQAFKLEGKTLLVRYEDVLRDPSVELDRLLTHVYGEQASAAGDSYANKALVVRGSESSDHENKPIAHTVGGNPSKFIEGELTRNRSAGIGKRSDQDSAKSSSELSLLTSWELALIDFLTKRTRKHCGY